MKKILALTLVLFGLLSASPVMAVEPMLKFVPSTGSYANGETFKVTIGVDSGTETSQGVDAWVSFDASKLEVVSIDTAPNPAFSFALGKNIYNDTGKFDISCTSTDMGTYQATVLSGDLVVVTFRAKATGTVNVNFTCAAGSTIDSNIFNMTADDVIDCASNQNGTYTITAGSDIDPEPTSVTTTTTETTETTELPQTGGVETTIGLLIFGVVGLLSSLALRFL